MTLNRKTEKIVISRCISIHLSGSGETFHYGCCTEKSPYDRRIGRFEIIHPVICDCDYEYVIVTHFQLLSDL